MRRLAGFLLLLFASFEAGARTPEGRLDILRVPSDTRPAIVSTGGAVRVVLQRAVELRLVAADGTAYALNRNDAPETGALWTGEYKLTPGTPAGVYALEAIENGQPVDRNTRAVYVRESMPAAYAIAHIAMPRVGAPSAEDELRSAVTAVNAALAAGPQNLGNIPDIQPAFVLVTGDLTQDGSPEQYQAALSILDGCDLPTYVCPGAGDKAANDYIGPDPGVFTFGDDGYILYRMRGLPGMSDGGAQAGHLQEFRRWIKPCRWSIGVSDRYDPEMDLRGQMVLFIDDPLHCQITGVEKLDEKAPPVSIPWGHTRLIQTPRQPGALRPLIVAPRDIKALPSQSAAPPAK